MGRPPLIQSELLGNRALLRPRSFTTSGLSASDCQKCRRPGSVVSRTRIAPSKMLPSENRRAICDVTMHGAPRGPEESDIVTAHARWEYLKAIYGRYQQARRPTKRQILDECCRVTGYHRKHAVRLLNGPAPSGAPARPRRQRTPTYGPPVIEALRTIWEAAGYPWSVRLKALLPLWLPRARRRLQLSRAVERHLLAISPRQIDRRLAISSVIPATPPTARSCIRSTSPTSTRRGWRHGRSSVSTSAAFNRRSPSSSRPCPFASWASTPTMAPSSSTATSTITARPTPSSSPAGGPTRKTTTPTSSRRTGPTSASCSAISVTTRPPRSPRSTRSTAMSSACSRTSSCPPSNSSAKSASARGCADATMPRGPLWSACSPAPPSTARRSPPSWRSARASTPSRSPRRSTASSRLSTPWPIIGTAQAYRRPARRTRHPPPRPPPWPPPCHALASSHCCLAKRRATTTVGAWSHPEWRDDSPFGHIHKWLDGSSASSDRRAGDHSPPDDDVAAVEDHGLARAQRALRSVEDDFRGVHGQRAHRCRGGPVAVANLRFDPQRRRRRLAGDEVHGRRHEPGALEVRDLAHADRVALGIEVDDVERAAGREAESALLTNGVGRDATVRPEPGPAPVDDRARLEYLRRTSAKESPVVVVGHEADLLALGLVGGHQAETARVLPHLFLRELADREAGGGQLLLGERPQKVGLVLARVLRPQEQMAPRRRVAFHARVVSGRDAHRLPRACAAEKRPEL